ncbi:hypothetical protein AMAG_16795 [Allomyces macrogynus ATCC 38327]|uniref:Inositol hexakisphosphate and diphosphoinositol-pentakisphosphate kinase n=1 Tax=Allomyces macrogynus (strain ATCC 38327) TaxID=578462 RepID=A0A0L0TBW8_ALLM3|nr:hypothetical protein AMAG_16795 [Allomyces macrogynus ATCC 38327]|eukprot:KNE72308.1 hypothetical protein AMAG_16795 [Allomyces macrogynus ATCC 38327]
MATRSSTPTSSPMPSPSPLRARVMSGGSTAQGQSRDPGSASKLVIGVCAMDAKARSKPMRNILNRLVATGEFEVQIFGDKVILDEDVADWPSCNFLISFFSQGFPLDKAIQYVALRRPYLVNDLVLQKVLFDRRLVLSILDKIGVLTPRRVLVNRGAPPIFDDDVVQKVRRNVGLDLNQVVAPSQSIEQIDQDTLVVDGMTMTKPFVEKPVSGEDHNIYVYFHSSQGGGCRKLFRKIANKSSEFVPDVWKIRTEGSFIYEQFMDVDNAEDVKTYTIGPTYAHAETRKSPVVDGVVQRNHDGKEIRYITQLSAEEREVSRRVCMAFGQTICGFDLLRASGQSYVIDVNGWSFVKGNEVYYEKCASILRKLFLSTAKRKRKSLMLTKDVSMESQWRMKGFFSVIRHGDRTPKLKKKFNFKSAPFRALLDGGSDEVILKGQDQLARVAVAAEQALAKGLEDRDKLQLMLALLHQKELNDDTKVQVKPSWSKTQEGVLEKLQVIVKWGGMFTHAGHYQSKDLGENLRKDLRLINRELLQDVVVYSASEQRVVQTAKVFMEAFLDGDAAASANDGDPPGTPVLPPIEVRKDMLDDSNAAKEKMEAVKAQLKVYSNLRIAGVDDPAAFLDDLMTTMRELRDIFRYNFATLPVETLQPTWCCGETPALFRERWEKLFHEFCDSKVLDPSKASELHDSLKFDALHNRAFVSHIFSRHDEFGRPVPSPDADSIASRSRPASVMTLAVPPAGIAGTPRTSSPLDQHFPVSSSSSMIIPSLAPAGAVAGHPSAATEDHYPAVLRSLFRKSKRFFDFVAPSEYGLTADDKKSIGLLTSQTLVRQIVADLKACKDDSASRARTRLYFTKESHVHTLLNLVAACGVPLKVSPAELDELDYLTQITFELYERARGLGAEPSDKEYSVRISFSPGTFCAELVDLHVDPVLHAITAAPKRDLTDHVQLDEVIGCLVRLLEQCPVSGTAVVNGGASASATDAVVETAASK